MLLNQTDTKSNNKVNDIDSLWCTVFDHIRLCIHSCTAHTAATYFFRFHDWNRCVQCWWPLVVHVIELSAIWQTPITVGECGYSTKRSSDDHTPRPFNGENSIVIKVQTCPCVGCIFSWARQQLWPDASPEAANGWRLTWTQVHLEKVRCLKPLGPMSAYFTQSHVISYQRLAINFISTIPKDWIQECRTVKRLCRGQSCVQNRFMH